MRTLISLIAALLLVGCGGDDDTSTGAGEPAVPTAEDVAAAFEEAGGGYPFEKKTSLVDGAVAYGPVNSADVAKVTPLNEALGDSSILWQVYVFDGPAPPVDEAAAKAAAFSSNTFEEIGEGTYLGDNDTAYAASGNVVVSGPVGEQQAQDETLKRWLAVIQGL